MKLNLLFIFTCNGRLTHIALLACFIANSSIFFSQDYCAVLGQQCSMTSSIFEKYIPDDLSPILTINLNFHYYVSSDPFNPQNFTASGDGVSDDTNPATYSGQIASQDLVNMMNFRLSNEGNPQMNLPPQNTTAALPFQFRFRVNQVYYHTWSPTISVNQTSPANDGYSINVILKNDDDHVMLGPKTFPNMCNSPQWIIQEFPFGWDENGDNIPDPNPFTPNPYGQFGWSSYGSDQVEIREAWTLYKYYRLGHCNPSEAYSNFIWSTSRQILHELGHAFCLQHTVLSGNGTNNDCNNAPDDYCNDTPQNQAMLLLTGHCPSNCGNTSLSSNNLMDYCNSTLALTPQQLGRFYYNLYNDHLFAVDPDYCQHDQSMTKIESGEHRIWEGMRICKGDIIVKTGGTLTLKGRLWMPHKGKIIVEPGAQFLVDGGCIGNKCGELWEGIEVWGNSS